MTTNAYLSNIKVDLVGTASPITYTTLPEVMGGVQVGETLPLVDVTHLQSTSREYIGGLPDGDEFSLECNRIITSSPDVQALFISLKGQTRTLRITDTNTRVSPNVVKTYTFSAVFLGWTLNPGVGEQDKITFNFKISGGVTIA